MHWLILTTTPRYDMEYMHKIVELNELNIFCEFFTISSQIYYCVILVCLWNNNSYVISPSTYNICITIIQCWSNVEDVGPTLNKWLLNLCGAGGDASFAPQANLVFKFIQVQLLQFDLSMYSDQLVRFLIFIFDLPHFP